MREERHFTDGFEEMGRSLKRTLVSMAIGGLAGAVQVMGMPPFRITAEAILPGYGFNGIAVSLIGNNHPFGVILGATMMGVLEFSRNLLQGGPKYPKDLISVISAVFIYFIATGGIITLIINKIKSLGKKKVIVHSEEEER